jgi:HK97 family phage portal protein
MGIFNRKQKKTEERKLSDIRLESYAQHFFSSSSVNALANQCENIISNSIAQLPMNLYFKMNDGGRVKAFNHPLYSVAKRQPNIELVPFTFYSQIARHLMQDGNAYLFKDMSGDEVRQLFILDPKQMQVERDEMNRKKFNYGGKPLNPKEVLHIIGLGFDGLKGKGVLEYAQEQIDLARTMDEFAAESFGTTITKRPVIDISEMYQNATPEDVERIGQYIKKNYADNNKPLITFNGMKFESLDSDDNRTRQLLENREFQMKVISSLYNIPYSFLTGEQVNVSLEVQNTNFLRYTLMPWIKIIEQYFSKLLTPFERERHYFEFNTNGFLRADFKSRMEGYATGIRSGVLSHNDIQKLENGTVLDNEAGDTYFVESNLMPLRPDIINAYMSSAKQKMNDAPGIGDDKK